MGDLQYKVRDAMDSLKNSLGGGGGGRGGRGGGSSNQRTIIAGAVLGVVVLVLAVVWFFNLSGSGGPPRIEPTPADVFVDRLRTMIFKANQEAESQGKDQPFQSVNVAIVKPPKGSTSDKQTVRFTGWVSATRMAELDKVVQSAAPPATVVIDKSGLTK
jgi:hypothetical protein